MDFKIRNDYIKEVEDLGLPRIKSTSKIQRSIMSVTLLDSDTTRIISDYYFPIDIDAVVFLAKVDLRIFRIVLLLACDMGIWPIARIVTRKFGDALKESSRNASACRMQSTVSYFRGCSLAQTYYNLASYKGYQHIADLFVKHGASVKRGVKFLIQGSCMKRFDKVFRSHYSSKDAASYLNHLCGGCRWRTKVHIQILRDLIYQGVKITENHLTTATKNTPNPQADTSKQFLSIIDSRICRNVYY